MVFLILVVFMTLHLPSSPVRAEDSGPKPIISFKAIVPTTATRSLDEKGELLMSHLRSDPSMAAILDQELEKPKPFSSGLPPAVVTETLKWGWGPFSASATYSARTRDIRDVWSVWCEASWDGRCEGTETWIPPNNWDICRFSIAEESKTHGEWAVVEANAKKIRVHVKSHGSGAFFDKWGGYVRVKLVHAQLIPTAMTPEERVSMNCNYNNGIAGAGGTGAGLTEYALCLPNPKDTSFKSGIQMCADYIYENGVKKYTRGPYPCGVCFLDNN